MLGRTRGRTNAVTSLSYMSGRSTRKGSCISSSSTSGSISNTCTPRTALSKRRWRPRAHLEAARCEWRAQTLTWKLTHPGGYSLTAVTSQSVRVFRASHARRRRGAHLPNVLVAQVSLTAAVAHLWAVKGPGGEPPCRGGDYGGLPQCGVDEVPCNCTNTDGRRKNLKSPSVILVANKGNHHHMCMSTRTTMWCKVVCMPRMHVIRAQSAWLASKRGTSGAFACSPSTICAVRCACKAHHGERSCRC